MPPVFGLRATGFTAPQPIAATSKVISSLFTDVNAAGYHVSKKKSHRKAKATGRMCCLNIRWAKRI